MSKLTIDQFTEACEAAFWTQLADMVPADTGDIDPGIEAMLTKAMRTAIAAWIETNAPTHDVCVSCGEQRPVAEMQGEPGERTCEVCS